jgi:SAM-dependent methyltransferase
MLLEHVSCDLCGHDKYRERYRKPDDWLQTNLYQFPVVECLNCGLVYVNPRPTTDYMSSFYPAGYHDNRDSMDHRRRYAIQKSMLPDLSGKHVLDIGCASGAFLSFLLGSSPSFSAHGVDAYCDHVADKRIKFFHGDFLDAGYDSCHFDIVMSWAVFEHLHAPTAYFQEAARVLKPYGKLIILVTNSESAYGRLAYAEDVPRHTYHYSSRTLNQYGAKVGFRLVSIDFRDDIFDGRGFGTFKFLLAKVVGFTWENYLLGRLKMYQRVVMWIGKLADWLIFSIHWEARFKRSGIMVAIYEKA